MADLSLTYSELDKRVKYLMHGDRDATVSSAEQFQIDEIINDGYRAFLYPALSDPLFDHIWSFMIQPFSLSLVSGQHTYTLPETFSDVYGPLSYAEEDLAYIQINLESVDKVLLYHSINTQITAYPTMFAIRPVTADPANDSQQIQEMLLWPTPDGSYTLKGRQVIRPSKLDSTNKYPLGGVEYSQVLLASVLAAAELQMEGAPGPYSVSFSQLLAGAIQRDRNHTRPKFLGQMSDSAALGFGLQLRDGRYFENYNPIKYNGQTYTGQ